MIEHLGSYMKTRKVERGATIFAKGDPGTGLMGVLSGAVNDASKVLYVRDPRARHMLERAIVAGVPFAWVAADTVYGVGELEMALRRAGKGYVLGVTGAHHVRSWGVQPIVSGPAADVVRSGGTAVRTSTRMPAS